MRIDRSGARAVARTRGNQADATRYVGPRYFFMLFFFKKNNTELPGN
eukprot:SAG31_NODE_25877_length_452_cov_0.983003_1_plen_46_part_10